MSEPVRRQARAHARTVGAAAVLAALLALALPQGASAIILSSQITTPAGSIAYPLSTEGGTMTVSGNSPTMSGVDIVCAYDTEKAVTLAKSVPVKATKFSVEVSTEPLDSGFCALRAIPEGSPLKAGPGEESEFNGPLLAVARWQPVEGGFFTAAVTAAGGQALYFEQASEYPLEGSLYSYLTHKPMFGLYGDAGLGYNPVGKRAQLQIDGHNAYTQEAAKKIEAGTKQKGMAGVPTAAFMHTYDPVAHAMTILEEEPLVRCLPLDTYPATAESCKSFAPLGVTLVRTWRTDSEAQRAWQTDAYRSNDGAAHTVDARYAEEMQGYGPEGGAWRFAGEAAFGPAKSGQDRALPAGPGLILYKSMAGQPDTSDGAHPQVAVAYETPPTAPAHVLAGTAKEEPSLVELPYTLGVPAGGSSQVLRTAYAESFALGEAQALAEGALASYRPSIAITSPANGSSTTTPAVTVTGTASDGVAVSSVKVDGTPVALGAGGAWAATVALVPGANTITATAQSQAGVSSSAQVTVTYIPPPVLTLSGTPSGRGGHISLVIACAGQAGQSCSIALSASTLEKLRHGHLYAISAATKTRTRRVTVASRTLTLAAGRRVTYTLGLNRTGVSLLGRFGSLPVTLTVQPSGAAKITRRLTVKPAPRRRKKH